MELINWADHPELIVTDIRQSEDEPWVPVATKARLVLRLPCGHLHEMPKAEFFAGADRGDEIQCNVCGSLTQNGWKPL